jgi:hypothetical protein
VKASDMGAVEGVVRSSGIADMRPGQLLAIAAVVAAVLFGIAGLIGAIGYLVSVSRYR